MSSFCINHSVVMYKVYYIYAIIITIPVLFIEKYLDSKFKVENKYSMIVTFSLLIMALVILIITSIMDKKYDFRFTVIDLRNDKFSFYVITFVLIVFLLYLLYFHIKRLI